MNPDKSKPRKPILETAARERAILDELRKPGYDFIAAPTSGLSPERVGDEVGWVLRSCFLSQLRAPLSIQGGLEDDKIFAALDALTKAKALIVWRVELPRWMAGDDVQFELVLGGALLGYRKPYTAPQTIPRWLDGELFKRAPWRPLNVSQAVAAKRKQAQDRLERRRFHHLPDLELESRLHREEVEEQAHLKAAIMKLADLCGYIDRTDVEKLLALVKEHEK